MMRFSSISSTRSGSTRAIAASAGSRRWLGSRSAVAARTVPAACGRSHAPRRGGSARGQSCGPPGGVRPNGRGPARPARRRRRSSALRTDSRPSRRTGTRDPRPRPGCGIDPGHRSGTAASPDVPTSAPAIGAPRRSRTSPATVRNRVAFFNTRLGTAVTSPGSQVDPDVPPALDVPVGHRLDVIIRDAEQFARCLERPVGAGADLARPVEMEGAEDVADAVDLGSKLDLDQGVGERATVLPDDPAADRRGGRPAEPERHGLFLADPGRHRSQHRQVAAPCEDLHIGTARDLGEPEASGLAGGRRGRHDAGRLFLGQAPRRR